MGGYRKTGSRLQRLEDLERMARAAEPDNDVAAVIAAYEIAATLLLAACHGKEDRAAGADADFECTLAACSPAVAQIVRDMTKQSSFCPSQLEEIGKACGPLGVRDRAALDAYLERASERDRLRRAGAVLPKIPRRPERSVLGRASPCLQPRAVSLTHEGATP